LIQIHWRSSITFENWLKTHKFASIESIKSRIRDILVDDPTIEGESILEMYFTRKGKITLVEIYYNVEKIFGNAEIEIKVINLSVILFKAHTIE